MNHWWHNDLKVGPNYGESATPTAAAYREENSPRISTESFGDPRWWRTFNDPDLETLIEGVYRQNLTLKQAAWRIEESRSLLRIQSSNLLPQRNSTSGAYSRNQNNSLGPPVSSDLWDFGFNSSWELDLWGRIRRNIDASEAQLCASVKDYDFALVTLIGDTASLYIQYRSAEERLELARKNIKSFQGSLQVAKDRKEEDVATAADVAQAESNLLATQALVPRLEFSQRQALNALAVLTGIPPGEISYLDESSRGLPELQTHVMVGIPADLVRRRPDIRAAERNLKASFEAIGIAESDLYPSFSIAGNLGYQAAELRDLFSTTGFNGGVGPSFSWNILNFGRIKNQVAANEARFNQLRLDFENRVLVAQQEVETSMYEFIKLHEEYEFNVENERATREAGRVVLEQFKEGDVDFGRVFVVQSNLVQIQDALVANRASIALALIDTYRSLGGGWEIRCGGDAILHNVAFETEVVSPFEQSAPETTPINAALLEEAVPN